MAKALSPAGRAAIARHKNRPNIRDYIALVFDDFIELHGDRLFGDDGAVCGGLAFLDGRPVTVIGHAKGRNTRENIRQNFGMPQPEGYRKALRLMRQAEKFARPVICLVDTPGAHCGVEAEERGQGEAIARCLLESMGLKTPVVSVITGEGGSGGALALAAANRVLMLENAVYSVISPRGFASILWKDASREDEAAALLKMTARELLDFRVIDGIIAEPDGGAHTQPQRSAEALKAALISALADMSGLRGAAASAARYERFERLAAFSEIIGV